MENIQFVIKTLRKLNSDLIYQIAEFRKECANIKADNIEVKTENIEIKAENMKLKQTLEKYESRFMKLECDVLLIKKQNLQNKDTNILKVPVNLQVPSLHENSDNTFTKDISSHIDVSQLKAESQPNEKKAITSNSMHKTVYNSTQSESLTDPESSITSLPQDIIDDNIAKTFDFVEMKHKEPKNFSDDNVECNVF
ncbi:hypothetical protein Glove_21g45 [Diversispora epigaea]|uniref:Uncharacterized protein n=1 Tax=Diversispora epigaea TaxID=1348612 RepID=A0A397JVG8_9GLOM|nr:hypothetical protein Glove_21g45 [Diversispora epigaea]